MGRNDSRPSAGKLIHLGFPSSEKSFVTEDETVAGLTATCHDSSKYVFRASYLRFCVINLVLQTSPTVVMAEKKKLTTEEIIALARQQKSDGDDASAKSKVDSDSGSGTEATPPAEEKTAEAKKPAATPKSTADILAAARAQAAGGKKPAEKPSSTADILAAARAQAGGAKPAAAPKSTSDILAAARAQGGGAAKASPAKPAAAEKPAAKKAAPVAGDRPALKDMVAAVKEAHETGAPAKPKLPAGRPAPMKPKFPKRSEKVQRRGFVAILAAIAITPFALAWSAMGAIGAIWSLDIARYMMPNMVLELPSRFKVGPPSDYPPGVVSAKFKASRGVWIINSDEYNGRGIIYALASICTHLGCTPNWLEGEQKFKCPCHGSGFYITGINFEGPAPRPLERVGIRVSEDGSLEVDKSMKFQEELGQWSDMKSYVDA